MSTLVSHFPPNLRNIYDEDLANQLAQTQGAIGSLRQTSRLLQNPNLLMRPILGKEAESSSQLEGTQASIEDVYRMNITEQTQEQKSEAKEIQNYEQAMNKGLQGIKKYGFTELVIREMHRTLLKNVRGKDKNPGEYRKDEVWIGREGTRRGEARYLPPDALQVPPLMEGLFSFISSRGKINPLIACGVIHHRFEAIHPFKDGNGRLGRLMITLYLIQEGLIEFPILYPSGFFEKNKDEYQDALSAVDKNENWYKWLFFFLKGLQEQAELSLELVFKIDELYKKDKVLIEQESARMNFIKVLEHTFMSPYTTASIIQRETGTPSTSSKRYLNLLTKKGILLEFGFYKKQKVFVNESLLRILREI